jgi:membrane protein DedA with SNARE-associated domain
VRRRWCSPVRIAAKRWSVLAGQSDIDRGHELFERHGGKVRVQNWLGPASYVVIALLVVGVIVLAVRRRRSSAPDR